MVQKHTKEQFWELYKKLPQELKNALFAEEAGNNIYDVCKRYEIQKNLDQIVEFVGQVLVGILPPDEFQETIERELELKKDVAKKVAQEINRFVFYPVKRSLEELYSMEITSPAQMKVPGPIEKKPKPPKRKDTYREVVE